MCGKKQGDTGRGDVRTTRSTTGRHHLESPIMRLGSRGNFKSAKILNDDGSEKIIEWLSIPQGAESSAEVKLLDRLYIASQTCPAGGPRSGGERLLLPK